jgi:hypothetical protein
MDATSIPCGQSVITARRSSGRIFTRATGRAAAVVTMADEPEAPVQRRNAYLR